MKEAFLRCVRCGKPTFVSGISGSVIQSVCVAVGELIMGINPVKVVPNLQIFGLTKQTDFASSLLLLCLFKLLYFPRYAFGVFFFFGVYEKENLR